MIKETFCSVCFVRTDLKKPYFYLYIIDSDFSARAVVLCSGRKQLEFLVSRSVLEKKK